MAFLEWIIGAGLVAFLAHNAKENYKRQSTPCYFNDDISWEEFGAMAKQAVKGIRRLSDISVEGPIVKGIVKSQSGITEWNFSIDFNDYGKITGKYWISSDNSDSQIPKKIAESIKAEIYKCQREKNRA